MKITSKETHEVLVAMRKTGPNVEFLQLHESPGATSYNFTEDISKAYKIHNRNPGEVLRDAPYYFENSDRARNHWLEDCRVVPVTVEVTYQSTVWWDFAGPVNVVPEPDLRSEDERFLDICSEILKKQ